MDWISILKMFGPAVLAFMTPERCKSLIHAVSETIEFTQATMSDATPQEQYDAALEFARAQYDLLDSVAHLDAAVDESVKNTVLPFLLGFIYHDGSIE